MGVGVRLRYDSNSESETEEIAKGLWRHLRPGDNVLLSGELGSGKSFLVRSFLKLGGYEGLAPSPTFSLMLMYDLNLSGCRQKTPCCHIDLYRIRSEEECFHLGIHDLLEDKQTLVLIEWGRNFANVFEAYANKEIALEATGNQRKITLSERR